MTLDLKQLIWPQGITTIIAHLTQGQSECSPSPSLVRTLAAYAFREQRTDNDAPSLDSLTPTVGIGSVHTTRTGSQ